MGSPQNEQNDENRPGPNARIIFLTLHQIEAIHADQLDRYGGRAGYLNKTLIESAVASPKQTMFGRSLYEDIADMASVYLFQISESQGFVDGNKRTGAAACNTFLLMNGYELACDEMELYDITMRVANKHVNRAGIAAWIRERISRVE